MADPEYVIPYDRLPEGFARRLDAPGEPARPRPAATAILLRDGGGAPEVLLLRRTRSAGFVPGAYVFPGGRVDPSDGAEELGSRLAGGPGETWAHRLGTAPETASREGGTGKATDFPAFAHLVAALRETFEETGVLVGRSGDGAFPPAAAADPAMERRREELLAGEADFLEVLREMDLALDDARAAYVAHWVTPEAEPRRYDTRFFAVHVPADLEVAPAADEITDHRWLSPDAALERHGEGKLPMVFPTIRTLEDLRPFRNPEEVLEHFRSREIPRILPRLVRTPTGVGLEVPDPG